jgi:hypothetical protein
MNREKPETATLDEVLDQFLVSTSADNPGQLAAWIDRYPQYRRELTNLALDRLQVELHASASAEPDDDPEMVERGMSLVEGILRAQRTSPAAQHALQDLFAEAAARGLGPRRLATALRLTPAMLRRLERRLIRFSSIPSRLIQHMASLLECDIQSVTAYFQRPPVLAAGVQYKSEGIPTLGEPVDFTDALRTDPAVSADDLEYWLGSSPAQDPL